MARNVRFVSGIVDHEQKKMDVKELKTVINNMLLSEPIIENGYDKYSDPNFPRGKFPGALPVCMTRAHMDLVKGNEYAFCEKTDGERCLVLFFRHFCKRFSLVVYRNWEFWELKGLSVHESVYDGTILDCEFIARRFYIFDVLKVAGHMMKDRDLYKRLAEIEKFCSKAVNVKKSRCEYDFMPKKMYPVSEFKNKITDMLMKHSMVDGIIFTPVNQPAIAGTNYELLKFKFDHTVDFRLVNGKLFIDGTEFPIHPDGRLRGTIRNCVVECSHVDGKWKINRVRNDKTSENSRMVFDRTMELIKDDFDYNALTFGLCEMDPVPLVDNVPDMISGDWGKPPEPVPYEVYLDACGGGDNRDVTDKISKMSIMN